MNDLPSTTDKDIKMILYDDDTSILIMGANKRDFNENCKKAFQVKVPYQQHSCHIKGTVSATLLS